MRLIMLSKTALQWGKNEAVFFVIRSFMFDFDFMQYEPI